MYGVTVGVVQGLVDVMVIATDAIMLIDSHSSHARAAEISRERADTIGRRLNETNDILLQATAMPSLSVTAK